MSILSKALFGDQKHDFSYRGFQKWAADRSGWDGGPPNIPMPNIPTPNDRNFLAVFNEKFSETLAAVPGFIDHHARNLEMGWKGLWSGLENPEKSYNEAWGGGNWQDRFGIGGGDSGGSSTVDTSGSGGTEGGGGTSTGGDGTTLAGREEERARLDAIRRMLAGRYGRGETNLTGGSSYGKGEARGLGGY